MTKRGGLFRHAVASGDPLADRVVLWTRVTTGSEEPVELAWTIARDPDLRDVVASGTAASDPDADQTVHVEASGLEPGTRYHYGFEARGERSPVARTGTLPGPGTEHLRFAMCSCAKYSAGFFNAYARIADRHDVQFLLHLGDYIYEVSNHPPPSQTPPADIGRSYDPDNECVTLEDYRRRYAHYRLDPDVQRLHLTHPVIATVDDHEFADGVWREGSIEHREDRDGPWSARRAAAFRSRWEWQPYRMPDPADPERVWRTVDLGGLAELFLIDTRSRRDEPIDGAGMRDPARSQLGPDQRAWLLGALSSSTAAWRLLGNSSVMGHIWDPRLTPAAREGLGILKMVNPEMTGPDPDQWDGYPAERDAILRALARGPDTVVLSGDVHVGLALDRVLDPRAGEPARVGGEFVTTSLTSQNVDDKRGWPIHTGSVPMERAFVESLPHVRYTDFDSHGYVMVDVTPERVLGEWWFVDSVLERTGGEARGAAWQIRRGERRLEPAPVE